MSVADWLIVFAVTWLSVCAIVWLVVMPVLRLGPDGRADFGVLWLAVKVWGRVVHRVTFSGLEHLPRGGEGSHEGLIVVSNHTGAADAFLIQIPIRFWVRWMMAKDMMTDDLGWVWNQQNLIPVDRDNPDSTSLREAIRHVRKGGAIGIFPEGRITMPPREIRPFLPGVGLIIARAKSPVLLVWVSGTPDTNKMMESLLTRSRAHVHYLGMYDFTGERDAEVITNTLRQAIHDASGWPLNDEVLPPGGVPAPATDENGVDADALAAEPERASQDGGS